MGALRLLLTADPELPVPPRLYGGIERIIALLADGLSARGHDVTLVAHRDSAIAGRLVPYVRADGRPTSLARNAATIATAALRHRPDVIHSFSRLASLAGVWPMRRPMVMSYQRVITPRSVVWGRRLGGGRLAFTACSDRMLDGVRHLAPWRVIHNAVDTARYRYAPSVAADAPLVFLGRLEHIKGPHVAVEVARQTGRRLVLAGNVPDEHRRFFDEQVRPHVDGVRIRYVGPVDDAGKSALLSEAAALLMPILWEEPFGIVMAEALACGAPVIGLARGALPEVVDDGVTGAACHDTAGLVAAVANLARLDRSACRRSAESRFSQPVLVDAYESLYRELAPARPGRRVPAAAAPAGSVAAGGDR